MAIRKNECLQGFGRDKQNTNVSMLEDSCFDFVMALSVFADERDLEPCVRQNRRVFEIGRLFIRNQHSFYSTVAFVKNELSLAFSGVERFALFFLEIS